MSSVKQEEPLNKLEYLKNEYNALYEEVNNTYKELDSTQNKAYSLAVESANLIGSIKHAPITVSIKSKRILAEKEKVAGKSEIQKQERNRNMAAGATTVAGLSIGSLLLTTTFKDYFKSFSKKLGKYGGWIIALILVVIVFLFFLIWKAINQHTATKKAFEAIKTVSNEIAKLKTQKAKATHIIEKLTMQMSVVSDTLKRVLPYEGFSYLKIPKEDRPLLMTLYNDTSALNEIMDEMI